MEPVSLTAKQRRYLKGLAHPLKPLMQMGKDGPSPAFLKELDEQVGAHELIKVRILNNCEAERADIIQAIEDHGIAVVGRIGHVLTVFRQKEEDSLVSLP